MKIALRILGAFLILFLILALFTPKHHDVERSALIMSPSEIVFDQINDLNKWAAWSPWDKMDPEMKKTFGTSTIGAGSYYTWEGKKAGSGKLTITSSTPETIKTKVEFGGMGSADGIYSFKTENGGTNLSWRFIYDTPFPWNAFTFLMGGDKSVAKDFETGLANLKSICEKLAKEPRKFNGFDIKESEMPSTTYAYKRAVNKFSAIAGFLGAGFQEVSKACLSLKTEITGPPCGLYWNYDEKAGTTDMAAAMQIDRAIVLKAPLGTIDMKGKALTLDFYGPYDKISNAHQAMDEYMLAKNLKNKLPVIEQYITDPMAEKDTSKWLTKVIYYIQ